MWPFKPNIEKLKAKKDIEGLVRALDNKDPLQIDEPIYALGEISNEASFKALVSALNHPSDLVRAKVIELFTDSDDPRILKFAIEKLKDKSDHVRFCAVIYLDRMEDPIAVEPLRDFLRREGDTDAREMAEWALSSFQATDRDLILALVERAQYDPDAYGRIRENGETAVPFLIDILCTEESGLREGAVVGLGHILEDHDSELALKALNNAKEDDDKGVRDAAEWALKLYAIRKSVAKELGRR